MFRGSEIQSILWEKLVKKCNGDEKQALVIWNDALKLSKRTKKTLIIKGRQFGIATMVGLERELSKAMGVK